MSAVSKIEWTDGTWNPVRGCTKVSPGCRHCYAATFAERWRGTSGHPFEQGFDLRLIPEKLVEPLKWAKPRLIFANSVSDLFHPDVPDDYIVDAARIMALADWHTVMVLTKRAERMAGLLSTRLRFAADLDHVLWGVSAEDKKYGLPRIEQLQQAPARRRFISAEPLLESLGPLDLDGIEWLIVGGESGPGARPMDLDWARAIRDQCSEAGVGFHFKQVGGPRKWLTGRLLDGCTHDDVPRVPSVGTPGLARRRKLRSEAERIVERWVGGRRVD